MNNTELAIKEIREYSDAQIVFNEYPIPNNHLFVVRGKHCDFYETSTHVCAYLKPSTQMYSDILPKFLRKLREAELNYKSTLPINVFEIGSKIGIFKGIWRMYIELGGDESLKDEFCGDLFD